MSVYRILVFTDTHLTDRESDTHRWQIFPFLGQVEHEYGKIDLLAHLGDLTEKKDGHSSALLHRIVKELKAAPGERKVVLKGNHDYVEEGEPFFSWLSSLEDAGITYATTPQSYVPYPEILLLPHARNPLREWEQLKLKVDPKLVLTHITVDGAQTEMGSVIPGIPRSKIPGDKALVLSGDIHKPQQMGPDFVYVGTPYFIRYSPDYEPRVLLVEVDPDELTNRPVPNFHLIYVPTGLQRFIAVTVTMEELLMGGGGEIPGLLSHLGNGGRMRIRVKIPTHTLPNEWKEFKTRALEADWMLPERVSILPLIQPVTATDQDEVSTRTHKSPEDVLHDYCQTYHISQGLENIGSELLRSSSSKS